MNLKRSAGWLALLFGSLFALALITRALREVPDVALFIHTHPGSTPLPAGAPVGFPAWLGWQHFLNLFMIVFIIRTGWIIRSKSRPPAFWTRNDKGLVKLTGRKQRLGIYHWFHLSVDGLWVLNGLVFIVLLFVSGQWMRIVPTSWEVFPNALSALIQYLSLSWPAENAWVNYNSLQVLAYFVTVFIAAPIAIKTGLRLSPIWPQQGWLHRAFPEKLATKLHVFTMVYFCAFIVVHVILVLATYPLRNLNMMFAANDGTSWWGVAMLALAILAIIGGFFLLRPNVLTKIAKLSGKVQS